MSSVLISQQALYPYCNYTISTIWMLFNYWSQLNKLRPINPEIYTILCFPSSSLSFSCLRHLTSTRVRLWNTREHRGTCLMWVYHIPVYKKSTSGIFTIGSSGNFWEPQKKKIIIFCGFLQFVNGICVNEPWHAKDCYLLLFKYFYLHTIRNLPVLTDIQRLHLN